jgi:acyl carrier protein
MEEKEIIETTNSIFESAFEIEKERLKPEARIFEDLGLDSLDIVELVVGLQKKFGVRIRDNEKLREIRTLADVYKFMLEEKKHLEKGDASS